MSGGCNFSLQMIRLGTPIPRMPNHHDEHHGRGRHLSRDRVREVQERCRRQRRARAAATRQHQSHPLRAMASINHLVVLVAGVLGGVLGGAVGGWGYHLRSGGPGGFFMLIVFGFCAAVFLTAVIVPAASRPAARRLEEG